MSNCHRVEVFVMFICLTSLAMGELIVIAHRGASGYLPEHTLPNKAMAVAFGSDYIEQDLVMTKDDVLIVCHDLHLDTTTNIADVYKGRNRTDGRYYAIDFTWDEIRKLNKTSSFHMDSDGEVVPDYPGRFPLWQSTFQMNTFEDEIQMIQGLEKSMGKLVGIYPEIKKPQWHREQGKNISIKVLEMLKRYNYTQRNQRCYLQCFNSEELKQIRHTLMPSLEMDLKLVQLMNVRNPFQDVEELNLSASGNNFLNSIMYHFYQDYIKEREDCATPKDMAKIAGYAQGVGPNKHMIVLPNSTADNLQISNLVKNAHAAGLVVHPYTFRSDPGEVPPYAKDIFDLFRIFFKVAKIDGVFTDFPDKGVKFLSSFNHGHRIEGILCSIFIGVSSSLLANFCSGVL